MRRFELNRAPTGDDYKNFKVGDEWLDSSSDDWYKLCAKSTGTAIWRRLAGTGGSIESIIPDTGTSPVLPSATNQITFAGGNGIQTTGGAFTITHAMNSPFTGSFTFENNTAATPLALSIENNDTDPGSYAALYVSSEPLGGDCHITWEIDAATKYFSMGIDNSDSDRLKLTDNVDPSSGNEIFMVDTVADSFTFYQSQKLQTQALAGGDVVTQVQNTDNTNIASNAKVEAVTGGASGGDPFFHFEITGGQEYSLGPDNDDSATFKLTDGATPSAGSTLWSVTSGGVIWLGIVDIDGGTIDGCTLGTNSPITEAQVDNININGNTISSTSGGIILEPFDDTCLITKSAATGVSFTVQNTSTTVGSDTFINLETTNPTASSTGSDPYIRWTIAQNPAADTVYAFGPDNSDSDSLKLSVGANPGTGYEACRITTAGRFHISAVDIASGTIDGCSLGITVPMGIVNVDNLSLNDNTIASVSGSIIFDPFNHICMLSQSYTGTTSLLNQNTNAVLGTASAVISAETGGASAGDPYFYWYISGATGMSLGLDNSDSDTLKLTDGVGPSAGSTLLSVTTGGIVTLSDRWAFDDVLQYASTDEDYTIRAYGSKKLFLNDSTAGNQVHVYSNASVNTAEGFSIGTVSDAGASADHMFVNWDGTNHVAIINAYSGASKANRYMPINISTQSGASVNIGSIRTTGDTVKLRVDGTTALDNINIDTNTISSTTGDILITPLAGEDVVIDSHWEFDGNTLNAITDNDTVITAYTGKNITIEDVTFDGGDATAANFKAVNGNYEVAIGNSNELSCKLSGVYTPLYIQYGSTVSTSTVNISNGMLVVAGYGAEETVFNQNAQDTNVRFESSNYASFVTLDAGADTVQFSYLSDTNFTKFTGHQIYSFVSSASLVTSSLINTNINSDYDAGYRLWIGDTATNYTAITNSGNGIDHSTVIAHTASDTGILKLTSTNAIQLSPTTAPIFIETDSGINASRGLSIGTESGTGADADHLFINYDGTNHVSLINSYSGSNGANRYMPINMATASGCSVNIGSVRTTGDTSKLRVVGTTSCDGDLQISTAGKQLQIEGGLVTDFIGSATLSSGTVTVANTNIAATDYIFITRQSINSSSALGMFTYSINAGTSFTITAVQPSTPASTETNDDSIVKYVIIRQL